MILEVEPCPAPRQVQSDKWRPRPPVLRYRAFKDELRLRAKMAGLVVPEQLRLTFTMTMPPSWSEKEKFSRNFTPHRTKPDVDNLVKAFLDALLVNDSHIHRVDARKLWGRKGSILIEEIK